MITNKTSLKFKEYVYLSVMWLLRQVLKTNYDNIKKTKYDIDSYEDYLLTSKIVTMMSSCDSKYPKSEKYDIKNFGDVSELGDEVMRYEKNNGIDWLTMDDKICIRHWREYTKSNIKTSLFDELRHKIIMEFF